MKNFKILFGFLGLVLILSSSTLMNKTEALQLNRFVDTNDYPFNLLTQEELIAFDQALVIVDDVIVSGSFSAIAEKLNNDQQQDLLRTLYNEDGNLVDESLENNSESFSSSGGWLKNHYKFANVFCKHKWWSWCYVPIKTPHE